jgi:membrane associated rhomboid family serine protease
MDSDKKRLINSFILPALFVFLLWVIKVIEWIGGFSLGFLGVYPLSPKGLIGIVTAPLIHSDFSHLAANSVPLFILGAALVYFYREISLKVFFLIYLMVGVWVWVFAREAYHIGASGIVYGLASFIFLSGLIRRNSRLIALAMVVAFLYGSFVWGVFPEFFPEQNISWESHLMGIIAGSILAVYYRKEGPQREKYSWEIEEEFYDDDDDDDDDNGHSYWKTTITDEEIKNISQRYRPRKRR